MNTKLYAACDSRGFLLELFVTASQVSHYIGARAFVSSLPNAKWLLSERGYDADFSSDALKDKGVRARTPGRKQRKTLPTTTNAVINATIATIETFTCNALSNSD